MTLLVEPEGPVVLLFGPELGRGTCRCASRISAGRRAMEQIMSWVKIIMVGNRGF